MAFYKRAWQSQNHSAIRGVTALLCKNCSSYKTLETSTDWLILIYFEIGCYCVLELL